MHRSDDGVDVPTAVRHPMLSTPAPTPAGPAPTPEVGRSTMTNLRMIALTAAAFGTVALLAAVVAADPALWASWPGAVLRYCGFCTLAVGLYALAGRLDRRPARR
ncbi:hypothetical protein GC089_07840 [Cellulomonas sp. JZ18]|uniref:hypothetical protein n=1 Tax=Cellulomonas sp. JZ18 TaxID=2654191 RepID=UPI0012D3D9E5|nr:hypothetical protein [Cellulomonas sp. JZ18]QGQ19157.1 hypothetical protein GC089_07840 [Cellulomonas sp. JZ18]